MANILVIDDEARHCQSLQSYLSQAGHHVSTSGSAERGCEQARSMKFDAILLDIRLPGKDGLTAIPELKQLAPDAPVIIMTAFGTLETAVKAVQEGVFEYLVKPFSLGELKSVLNRALSSEQREDRETQNEIRDTGNDVVIGSSPAMQRIFNRIALVAASNVPVLLTGESGTGKEVLARAIHRYSDRSAQRFLPVFLAALSPGLIESELFGHTRGAYTGAELHRPGLLEQAEGGTVLLDELGDIPLPLQVKLLRAIEQREVTRVGEDQARPIDVRFIAATNKSLPDLISQGLFRKICSIVSVSTILNCRPCGNVRKTSRIWRSSFYNVSPLINVVRDFPHPPCRKSSPVPGTEISGNFEMLSSMQPLPHVAPLSRWSISPARVVLNLNRRSRNIRHGKT